MAATNNRVYDLLEAVAYNTLTLAGLTRIEAEQHYVASVAGEQDGLHGPGQIDHGGQAVRMTLASTDALKIISLAQEAIGDFVGSGQLSGVAGPNNFGKLTLVNPVIHALSFAASKSAYAVMTASGQCRFGDDADTFDDIEQWIDSQTEPTITYPARLFKPTVCDFGAASPISVAHVESIGFTLPGRLLTDYHGDSIGTIAVDRAGWGTPQVTMEIRDSAKDGINNWDIPTAMMKRTRDSLIVTMEAVDGGADQVLTLRNCKFNNKRRSASRGYQTHTLTGDLQWQDPDGTARNILAATTAVDRLINFANAV